LAVATKILHKKRPGLIPIFDDVVANQHYAPMVPNDPSRTWGDYAIELTRLVQKDMLGAESELRDLEGTLRDRGAPLTPCRILNALTWVTKLGYENWIIEQAGIARAIRKMPLERDRKNGVEEYVHRVMKLYGEE